MNLGQNAIREANAAVDTTSDRQLSEVKGMVFMAKQFPRDEVRALERILKSCERTSLAERATYEYPRGGTRVEGPSIRLAEALAQYWGNIDFGTIELEQRDGESIVMAYAWDLESNTRQTKVFSVPHVREKRSGNQKLSDPRDIYETVANMGARRLRACILGVIPGDVVDLAVSKCKETLTKGMGGDLKDVVDKMAKAFKKDHGITKKQLEDFIGCKVEAFTPNDVTRLRGVFGSLRDGMSTPEQYFGGKSNTESSPFDTKPEPEDAEFTEAEQSGGEQEEFPWQS